MNQGRLREVRDAVAQLDALVAELDGRAVEGASVAHVAVAQSPASASPVSEGAEAAYRRGDERGYGAAAQSARSSYAVYSVARVSPSLGRRRGR